jgi:hypothetical protein
MKQGREQLLSNRVPVSVPTVRTRLLCRCSSCLSLRGTPRATKKPSPCSERADARSCTAASGGALELTDGPISFGQVGVKNRGIRAKDNRTSHQLDRVLIVPLLVKNTLGIAIMHAWSARENRRHISTLLR